MNINGGNVLGVGVDLAEVSRIQKLAERYGKAFYEKIFTEEEYLYCIKLSRPWTSFAARFAAKEAVSKAFGVGIGAELDWKSVSIRRNENGAPEVVLDAKGEILLRRHNASRVFVSLTHTDSLAQAFAVLVR